MATDYDAPRVRPEDEDEDTSLEALRAESNQRAQATQTYDEANSGDDLELPGADLSGESLAVQVIPMRPDEFTCRRCFLVVHVSQRVGDDRCSDCA